MKSPIEVIGVGDRVRIQLESPYWQSTGWYEGTVRRVDAYSSHRSFYWVELDVEVLSRQGGRTNLVSVFNPKRIERL